ncbi:cold shock-induced protein TIR1-like [Miscanthus floridulus]|uniref:cold shock-induced protein TIR1-like n=1 Tax=Miscanthus floridulus TaxID=154761 RepID=UPI003459B016
MRAELPSPEVGAGYSTVLATSASATSFPREVSLEKIKWTSTSRVLSCDGGGPWTGGGIEACPASISASWAVGFIVPTPASATSASVVLGALASATSASVVLDAPAPVASTSEVQGASVVPSVASATKGASAPSNSLASASWVSSSSSSACSVATSVASP